MNDCRCAEGVVGFVLYHLQNSNFFYIFNDDFTKQITEFKVFYLHMSAQWHTTTPRIVFNWWMTNKRTRTLAAVCDIR